MAGTSNNVQRALEIIGGVVGLLNTPSVSVYWLYLASAALLATVVYVRAFRGRTSVWGWLRFLLPGHVLRHRSVRNDLALMLINTLLHSFVFVAPLQWLSTWFATHTWQGLGAAFGAWDQPLGGPGLWAGATAVLFVMADLAFYLGHRLLHRVSWLWELHKVHHSAPVLTPFSVFRRHPGDVFFDGVVAGVVIGVTYGVIGWFAGTVITGWQVLGVNALVFATLLVGFNLQHSHVWMTWGPFERVLISPAAHQIHHSEAPEHHDRNFGNMLSVWDRLGGTYVSPSRRRPHLQFGLGEETEQYRSVWRLYVVPLVRIFVGNASRSSGTTPS